MLIDKHRIYETDNYKFVNFIDLDDEAKANIREWRNHPDIRKFMYNHNEISSEEHESFIRNLPNSKYKSYWLVYRKDKPIGVINLVDIDYNANKAQLGYYLVPDLLKSGFAVEFLIKVYFFLFSTIQISCLYGATNSSNTNALVLAKFLGSEFGESFVCEGETYLSHFVQKEKFLSTRNPTDDMRTFIRYCKESENI